MNQTYRMWKNLILVNKVLCLLSIAINSLNISIACLQAVTGCFYRGKPGPFANRAPSWIFKTRGPGDERASAKIVPPAPLPSRRLFVNYRSPRSSASPIFQNGGQDSELRVFSPKKNSNAYR